MSSLRGSKAAAKSSNSSFARTTFFSLTDGESAVIRFLTDAEAVELANGEVAGGWISVMQHQNVKTKGAPADFKGNWPSHMTAICRSQDLSELGLDSPRECFLCDLNDPTVKLTKRTWALGVLREEVRDGQQILGYRDIKREESTKNPDGSDGPNVLVPAIVVLNFGYRNFFGPLEGYAARFGTVLDRDFAIKRTGAKTDTVYSPIGLDPIHLEGGQVFDVRDAEIMAKYLPEAAEFGYALASDKMLLPVISNRQSDEYFATFFDTRVTAEAPATRTVATTEAVAAPNNDAPAVDMEALKARLQPHPTGTASTGALAL